MNDRSHDAYHQGSRRLQERFDCRRIADRLAEVTYHGAFTDADRAFIESRPMFFLATADASGRPDCSFKGGLPGFVRVVGAAELAFPDYDGNGQFRSLGNIGVNPHVGLLFIDWERPRRLRINGTARVSADDPLIVSWPGAQLVTRVAATRIFPNCPRYVPTMKLVEHSVYAPRPDHEPPRPDWKDDPRFRDALPDRDLRP
jgi:predicted pyridoxine 5'-phosphate oxidase superfamily flavin-nucleotide-binding protein